MKKYTYGKQYLDDQDINSVVKVLQSNFLTQGPTVELFEESISDLVGANYAIAVNSATSALHIACLSMGLKKGDWLWTSPISFVASANCGLYCGADIDFVDIDKHTFNISIEALEKKLEIARKDNNLPKILVVVHMCGNPCDLLKIKDLCKEYGVYIIEDASHALGAQYQSTKIGDCKFSDITVFSFHPVKMITTGEGGVLTTNSEVFDKKLRMLRTHGITRDINEIKNVDGPWIFDQQYLGYNYRITDIACALGISQLQKLPNFLEKRNELANHYRENLESDLFSFQRVNDSDLSSYHLFIGQFREVRGHEKLNEFFKLMDNDGISLNIHYIPIYRHSYYANQNPNFFLENAENYYSKSFTLPLHYQLELEDIKYIANRANKNLKLIS